MAQPHMIVETEQRFGPSCPLMILASGMLLHKFAMPSPFAASKSAGHSICIPRFGAIIMAKSKEIASENTARSTKPDYLMRFANSMWFMLGFVLHSPSSSYADEARNILERAIKAHGGEARIRKSLKGHLQAQAEGKNEGNSIKSKYEEYFDLPARYLRRVDGVGGGVEVHMTAAVKEKTGWIRQGQNALQEFPVQEPTPVEQHWYTLPYLLLVLENKATKLTLVGTESKDGHSLVELKAVAPPLAVELWFDRDTGLVARARRPLPELLGLNAIAEIAFDKYRTIDGVHYPMRWHVTVGRNTSFTIDISSLVFLDRIDDSVFAKPTTPAATKPKSPADEATETTETTPPFEGDEEAPSSRGARLLILTLGMGTVIGGLWLFVRANKRRKQESNPL